MKDIDSPLCKDLGTHLILNNKRKFLNYNQQIQLLPNTDRVLFSSDILESIFGKYKNRVSENPMASITCLILTIASYTCSLTEENVTKSIENVKLSDIKKWTNENIPISLYKQRKVLLAA